MQPRTPLVQKQLLQELLPVSSPVQPLSTVSPPVSLHAACVVLGAFASWADKVPETFASTVASTARSWATLASTVASILGVGSDGVAVQANAISTTSARDMAVSNRMAVVYTVN